MPVETWPLLRHRMEVHRARPRGFDAFMENNPAYVEQVLAEVRARGPLAADDLPGPEGASRRIPGAWIGTVPRAVLEAHFGRGLLAVAERRPNFARTFDLAERRLPADHYERRETHEESQRELLRGAARAHGVGTAADLANYYHVPVRPARQRLADLVAAGELREVRVEGWREEAYLDPRAKRPRRIEAAALLSPFDPVVWYRPRTQRLFGFDYRLEIFVPQPKRRWGAYVLPFLLGDRLVARLDLKADRPLGRLRVRAAYVEPSARPGAVAEVLAGELKAMAAWLGLESVTVERRGGLARPLAAAVRA